jgi:hypothetical protein
MTDELTRLPLIGEKAPTFKAETTQGPISTTRSRTAGTCRRSSACS